jgi:hypothetical protein
MFPRGNMRQMPLPGEATIGRVKKEPGLPPLYGCPPLFAGALLCFPGETQAQRLGTQLL